ncbi:MAG: efflux RND transporter periplasmic adaptor subunit [Pirellulaceae bacterium]|nr:efflux RND transporter periplasmic adaptor subunit [Pirellulaceae bacterium]
MQRGTRNLAIGGFLAIVLAAGVAALWPRPGVAQAPKGPGGAPPPPKVRVTPVQEAALAQQRAFVGTIKPIRRSVVGSAAPGRVEHYLVNEGDAVQAGQPIAHLRRGIIQAELDAAKAQLAVRQAELAEMEQSHQEEIEQAQAKLQTCEANLAFRRAKVERDRALGTSIARELMEEDNSLAAQATAAVREAKAALRMLTDGPRQQKTEQHRAWVAVQTAEVQRLSEQFERHTMFAPFNGFVTTEHTEVGQWVMQGDPVAEIVELDKVDVEIAVLEDYVAQLDPDADVQIEVPALPGQQFVGRIALVVPQADAKARTFPVKVRIENQVVGGQPLLKAGMFARVSLPVGQPVSRIMVPKDAVVLGGPSPLVFVAATAGGKTTIRPVPVTLGPSVGTWLAISGPIHAGEMVVVEGNERIRPGQEVRPEMVHVQFPVVAGPSESAEATR